MALDKESNDAWVSFLNDVDQASESLKSPSPDEEIWFRGLTNSDYTLLPSLFRNYNNPNASPDSDHIWARESDLFWEFTSRARELHATLHSDWDFLFAMQHYRTPTRLLDWTEVLGVAVYFATLDVDPANPKGLPPPCVWIINPFGLNRDTTGNPNEDLYAPENLGWDAAESEYYTYSELLAEEELGFEKPLAIYPRQTNQRLHAQRAWFTIHGDDYLPLESMENSNKYLKKIELPFVAIRAARRFLHHAGINNFLLFADLENLSKFITEKNKPIKNV